MPKIKNIHMPHQITLRFDLVKNDSFIYNKENEDYLNWIPCDIKVLVEDKIYDFEYIPTLSLEGLKNLIKICDDLIIEKNTTMKQEDLDTYKNFEYYSTEGEFIISFRNIEDEDEEPIVETAIWINMAACIGSSDGYFTGFRFWVSLRELEAFFKEIKKQLSNLINNKLI